MTILQRWKQTALHNKALVLTSVLVAAGTLFYAGAAVWQICLMRRISAESSAQVDRLTNATNDAIGRAIAAATSANNAAIRENKDSLKSGLAENDKSIAAQLFQAKAALDASIDASRRDERAWLVSDTIRLSNELTPSTPTFTIEAYMVNSGKTPALDVAPQSAPSVWDGIPPFTKSTQPTAKRFLISPGSVSRRKFTTEPLEINDLPTIISYQGKRRFIYIRALVEYKDIFDSQHWISICASHAYGDPLDQFTLCDQGNDIDR